MPDFSLEQDLRARASGRVQVVVGIDEAGTGALAGPFTVAGVSLSETNPADWYDELDDSKALSPMKREWLSALIQKYAVLWTVHLVSPYEINTDGMVVSWVRAVNAVFSAATQQAAPNGLGAVVDGTRSAYGLPDTTLYVAHADSRSLNVAAASILAKVARDAIMIAEAERFPDFHVVFAQSKGYGTRKHRALLRKFGPTSLHRLSFIQKSLPDVLETA